MSEPKLTLSIIKADTGGFVGHSAIHPEMLGVAERAVASAVARELLVDAQVATCGDDLALVMTHRHGPDSPAVHELAWSTFRATTDYAEAIPDADAVVLVVPLFVDSEARPDFGWMDAATTSLGAHLTPGTLVSYETTLPVGTTRSRWKPMLEAASGLVEGTDFDLVFSPERVLTGRVFADLRKYPKLIGALSPEGNHRAREFYEAVLQFDERPDLAQPNGVWDLGSTEASVT